MSRNEKKNLKKEGGGEKRGEKGEGRRERKEGRRERKEGRREKEEGIKCIKVHNKKNIISIYNIF